MTDIQLVQFDPVTGLATLGLGIAPKKLTGLPKLVQIVALTFLKNPGQDVIDNSEGSGIRADIGQTTYSNDDDLKAIAIQRTKDVESQVLLRQPANTDPAEKLQSLRILDVAADDTSSSVVVRVQIFNEAGDTADILV